MSTWRPQEAAGFDLEFMITICGKHGRSCTGIRLYSTGAKHLGWLRNSARWRTQ